MGNFLNNSKNIIRDSYIWNMIGSLLLAFQSVILLMVLTRIVDLNQVGIFTFAYANANLFFTIGKYGMRYFQDSDTREQFTFGEYITSRVITAAIMMVSAIIYTVYIAKVNEYTMYKTQVVLFTCVFKLVDVIEDVFYGRYQQKGRLDIAAKAMTLRVGFSTVIFVLGILIAKNVLVSLVISTILSFIILLFLLKWTIAPFAESIEIINMKNVKQLLMSCFPLFAGAFLSLYIGNAPKYSIDALLSDDLQACYGFISMPVMVIGVLNGIIFNPMIQKMSILWNESKVRAFVKRIIIQIAFLTLLTAICIIGAYFLGIPLLSLLYHTDLSMYKSELMILLLGGGLLGLSGLLNTVITIIRRQRWILAGYCIVSVLALGLSDVIVKKYEIMGAAILYLVLMAMLSFCFGIFLVMGIMKKPKTKSYHIK